MVSVDQQPADGGGAAARYPAEEVADAVAFLNEITASLEAAPDVRDGLLGLLAGLGEGRGDAHAVASRAELLLREHSDVLDRFSAFLRGAKAPAVPASPQGLALTRPRRSNTRRCWSVPVAEEPNVAGSGGAGGHAQDYMLLPKSETDATGDCGGRTRQDPRLQEAFAFQDRVRGIAGPEVLAKLVAVLQAEDRFADVIYNRAKNVFGPANDVLLGEFATTFLPGEKEWGAHEARRRVRERRRAAASASRAAAADAADYKNRRADDGDHRQHGLGVGERSSGGGTAARTQYDCHATMEIVKRRRADDGNHRGDALLNGESSGAGRGHGHDDDNYAPRIRIKKPRADDDDGHRRHALSNGCSGSRAAPRVLNGGDVHGCGGDKKPRRRAPNGGEGSSAAAPAPSPPGPEPNHGNELFRQYRELWVFYTRYSMLVNTMGRVEELLQEDGGAFPTSVEELFPRREQREFLSDYYGDLWGTMRAALEGGESTGPALEAVLESLQRKEGVAVAEERERRRQDAARAAERLSGLVTDRVHHEELRQLDAGDGSASGRHARPRR